MDENSKLEIINQSASEMLDRMINLKNKDDRGALLLEVGEWVFMDIELEDELFIPNWEEVNHAG